ncbi:restriction endonuclease subunit S [Streptomyces sp. NBC_01591]|uniref:restriction endonuclease subunit S n=1 Tax=Streptomyces sp. NBC_01591 TaxID=2975888 RepID=UPI002DDB676A|nr:restriction endonuclease subunit S [Streptomyces sp. NBC_01591]WSD72185.1 restriction endonuclease subunit S [Streptomyces sp. NBC_01591]
MTSIPWLGEVRYPVTAAKYAFEITLGKMFQASPSSETDTEVPYFKSVSIQWKGIQPNHSIRMWATPIERRELAVHPGDLLICEGGDVGRAAIYDGPKGFIFEKSVHRARPIDGSDTRYLGYVVRALHSSEWLDVLCNKATIRHLTGEKLGALEIPVPPQEEQRRIADFLDAETAHMSKLTATLQRFEQDVRERERAVLARLLNAGAQQAQGDLPSGWGWTPLMYLTNQLRQIMYGIVLPGPNVADGVPIVKGGDVAANRLSIETLNRTTHQIESGYARSRLAGGDLVIAIRGSVGEVAVVPTELTGANLTQDAARISIGPSTNANWLRLALESPLVVHQIQRRVTGATIKGINIWDLKRVLVPTPSSSRQRDLAEEAGRAMATHETLRSRVAQHRKLVTERRQALITAAVTGQFDVSTASGRNVTDGVHP